jgi:hypothetical protein
MEPILVLLLFIFWLAIFAAIGLDRLRKVPALFAWHAQEA